MSSPKTNQTIAELQARKSTRPIRQITLCGYLLKARTVEKVYRMYDAHIELCGKYVCKAPPPKLEITITES